jgi:hypothetical protein
LKIGGIPGISSGIPKILGMPPKEFTYRSTESFQSKPKIFLKGSEKFIKKF